MPNKLTVSRLKEFLSYDPETGHFTSLVSRGPIRPGDYVGTISAEGYRIICIDRRLYRAARLAWLYMTGAWPTDEVDHENSIRCDDRWGNLRIASKSQNNMNRGARQGTRSGLKGVSWSSRHGKWIARITVNRVTQHLGIYADAENAHAAYVRAAKVIHGEFARVS